MHTCSLDLINDHKKIWMFRHVVTIATDQIKEINCNLLNVNSFVFEVVMRPGLNLGLIIWVTFCPGQADLTCL